MPQARHRSRGCLISLFVALSTVFLAIFVWHQNTKHVATDVRHSKSYDKVQQPSKRQYVSYIENTESTTVSNSDCPSLVVPNYTIATVTVYVTRLSDSTGATNNNTDSTSSEVDNSMITTEYGSFSSPTETVQTAHNQGKITFSDLESLVSSLNHVTKSSGPVFINITTGFDDYVTDYMTLSSSLTTLSTNNSPSHSSAVQTTKTILHTDFGTETGISTTNVIGIKTSALTATSVPQSSSGAGHTTMPVGTSVYMSTPSITDQRLATPTSLTAPTSSTIWVLPPSLEYMHDNTTNAEGNTLIPQEAYDYIRDSIQNLTASLIAPEGQRGDCVPLPDDPCINIQKALQDPDLGPILRDQKDKVNNKDGKDHKGDDKVDHKDDNGDGKVDHKDHKGDDNDDHHHHHHHHHDDDDDDHRLLGLLIGTNLGIPALTASTIYACHWSRGHGLFSWFGKFLFHRSPTTFELVKNILPPSDSAEWGIYVPTSQIPPLVLPEPLVPIPEPPPPLWAPTPEEIEAEKEAEKEFELEDDGNREEDPDDDCPPKLEKARVRMREMKQEIDRLEMDLKWARNQRDKFEKDLNSCDKELDKLHEARIKLDTDQIQDAATKLRNANDVLTEKQNLVNRLQTELHETLGDRTALEQQLDQAEITAAQAEHQRAIALESAEAAQRFVREVQEQLKVYVDTNTCRNPDVTPNNADSTDYASQLKALQSALETTESRLRDANTRASTAEATTKAGQEEIVRIKSDLENCHQQLANSKGTDTQPKKPTETSQGGKFDDFQSRQGASKTLEWLKPSQGPSNTNAQERVAALRQQLKSCNAEKAEIEKGKCPIRSSNKNDQGGASSVGNYGGDAASDPRATTYEGCRAVLNEASADAHECYSQCSCPAGVVEGPDHLRRTRIQKRWFDVDLVMMMELHSNMTAAAAAA